MKRTKLLRLQSFIENPFISVKSLLNLRLVVVFLSIFLMGASLNAQAIPSWEDFKNSSSPAELATAKLVFSNVPTSYFEAGDWEKRGDGEPIRVVITPAQLENLSWLKYADNIQVIKIEIEEMADWSFLQSGELANLSATSNLEMICVSIQIPMSNEALLQNLNTIKLDNTTPAFYQYSVAE